MKYIQCKQKRNNRVPVARCLDKCPAGVRNKCAEFQALSEEEIAQVEAEMKAKKGGAGVLEDCIEMDKDEAKKGEPENKEEREKPEDIAAKAEGAGSDLVLAGPVNMEFVQAKGQDRQEFVRAAAKKATEYIEKGYWVLGRFLLEIDHGQYWQAWGWPSFEAYCDEELEYSYRKARYLRDIVGMCVKVGVEEGEVSGVPWTRMAELLPVLTKENKDRWLADAHSKSCRELNRLVKEAGGSSGPGSSAGGKEGGSSSGGSGGSETEAGEKTTMMTFALYRGQLKTVQRALQTAGLITGNKDAKPSHCLEMVCVEFNVLYPDHDPEADDEEQQRIRIEAVAGIVKRVEAMFGIQFRGFVDTKSGEIYE